MSAQAQMRAMLDQLMGTGRDGEFVYRQTVLEIGHRLTLGLLASKLAT